ncbi:hypothetical protein E2C01_012782 [Portunus trituberculatus]|uniref:Uncharacterized protein n=1 Tax=Portunus trituberculatus TaxID=210409 RepID=A0A5B7DES8_PORTR|nr:hypothetical protein [Portunus trituberculatus]
MTLISAERHRHHHHQHHHCHTSPTGTTLPLPGALQLYSSSAPLLSSSPVLIVEFLVLLSSVYLHWVQAVKARKAYLRTHQSGDTSPALLPMPGMPGQDGVCGEGIPGKGWVGGETSQSLCSTLREGGCRESGTHDGPDSLYFPGVEQTSPYPTNDGCHFYAWRRIECRMFPANAEAVVRRPANPMDRIT